MHMQEPCTRYNKINRPRPELSGEAPGEGSFQRGVHCQQQRLRADLGSERPLGIRQVILAT